MSQTQRRPGEMAAAADSPSICPAGFGGSPQKRFCGADRRMAPRSDARVGRRPPGRNSFASGRLFRLPAGAAEVARAPFPKAGLVAWFVACADVSSMAGAARANSASFGNRNDPRARGACRGVPEFGSPWPALLAGCRREEPDLSAKPSRTFRVVAAAATGPSMIFTSSRYLVFLTMLLGGLWHGAK